MNMHMLARRLRIPALLGLLLMLAATPGWAAVRAMLDRDTVYEGDSLTLTIEADGTTSAAPNLAPLEKDFEVLGTSTSTQMSIINGQVSNKRSWHVQLQPRRLGRLQIPAIRVGQEHTAPLSLQVTEVPEQAASQAGQPVFVEARVETGDKPVYVQQQIPYTVRLYYDGRVRDGDIEAPQPQDAVVEQLGEDRRYRTTIDGKPYQVIERHYVISPEKSGALHIPPVTFRGRVASDTPRRGNRPRSMMEQFLKDSPFANDPFFRDNLFDDDFFASPFGNPGQPVAVRSRAIDITVKPRPAAAGRHWLPAEAVTLEDSWTDNPPEFRVGEPVSRTITIRTRGLAGSQIPELPVPAPAHARLYPETPSHESRTDGKTIYGIRRQTLTYIPGRAGTLDIPAIRLDWWNTREDRADSTTLPAWQFRVLPGAGGKTAAPPPATQSPQTAPAEQAETPADETTTPGHALAKNWPWLLGAALGLLALVVLVVSALRLLRRRATPANAQAGPATPAPKAQPAPGPSEKQALQQLKQACEENDRHGAARALLMLGQARWPEDPPRSLGALAQRLPQGQAQLAELDRSLYAADGSDWHGEALWQLFRHGLPEDKPDQTRQDDDLPPLYPQRA